MLIRHGKLHDVIGHPAKWGAWSLVPALVELDGSCFSPAFHLKGFPIIPIPSVLRVPIDQQYDVAWVRARLPHAFGISPEPTEAEKALLAISFVGVREGAEVGIPFDVSDYYGKTSLTFSEHESDEALKQEIAHAFWNILLSEPDELSDFDARVFHVGAGVWVHYGCDGGEPYCWEEADEE